MPYATADLVDQHEGRIAICDTPFRDFGGAVRFHGRIRTVRCREDNSLVKSVLSEPGEGQILVVDGGGSLHSALVGDVIAGLGAQNGWAGVVIHGAIRDSAAMKGLALGVKALGTNPRKSGKAGRGAVDVPVGFGGTVFAPGAWLYADEDGIVVSADRL